MQFSPVFTARLHTLDVLSAHLFHWFQSMWENKRVAQWVHVKEPGGAIQKYPSFSSIYSYLCDLHAALALSLVCVFYFHI